jgi:hypothetical protein
VNHDRCLYLEDPMTSIIGRLDDSVVTELWQLRDFIYALRQLLRRFQFLSAPSAPSSLPPRGFTLRSAIAPRNGCASLLVRLELNGCAFNF